MVSYKTIKFLFLFHRWKGEVWPIPVSGKHCARSRSKRLWSGSCRKVPRCLWCQAWLQTICRDSVRHPGGWRNAGWEASQKSFQTLSIVKFSTVHEFWCRMTAESWGNEHQDWSSSFQICETMVVKCFLQQINKKHRRRIKLLLAYFSLPVPTCFKQVQNCWS